MPRYHIQGDGPPLALVHGWGATYSVWDELAPLLARHFTLIIVDLMDLGAYEITPPTKTYYEAVADALDDLRESLGIARWSVLSYSLGTRVGATYLRKYPLRVERAIYLCPINTRLVWAALSRPARWIHRVNSRPLGWFISGWRLRFELLFCAFNFARPAHLAIWTDEIGRQPVETLKRMLLELPQHGRAPYPEAPGQEVPQLFIWARRDVISRAPRRRRTGDIVLPLTHAAPVAAPAMVAEVALPFLNGETDQLAEAEVTAAGWLRSGARFSRRLRRRWPQVGRRALAGSGSGSRSER